MQRCVVEKGSLAAEQFDQLLTEGPLVGAGVVTCGSRRSNVAASKCDELWKWRWQRGSGHFGCFGDGIDE